MLAQIWELSTESTLSIMFQYDPHRPPGTKDIYHLDYIVKNFS